MEDINVILDESKLHLIMKDGLIYKNIMVDPDDPDSYRRARATRGFMRPYSEGNG